MTDKAKAPGSEIFDQALKNYEQTLRSGLKLQEEAGRWFTGLLTQANSAQDWQKRVTVATNEVISPAQKRMEDYLALIEQNNRTNVDLLKKALEAAQTAAPSECQAKWVDFWGATLNAMQANAQAVTQINAKMIDSWISFLKKNAVELSEAAPSKA
jgi:predicted methyltransferase